MFLWLAGLAVVLAATRTAERTGSRRDAVESICRRGLEIFLLGFLFRIQGFIVTPGGHPVTLFRVDILNIMGPSIAIAGLVWGAARTPRARVIAYTLLAAATTMMTPLVRASSTVGLLPLWTQWYLRPSGPYTEFTIFTMFPWSAFVFAGGAAGALIAGARAPRDERILQAMLFAVGAALVAIGFYTAGRPSIYHPASQFWTSSPTWFAIRVGILMIGLTFFYAVEQVLSHENRKTRNSNDPDDPFRAFVLSWLAPLASMGRSSLFIYWIHVELVYGYASWLWRHRLPLWGTAIAFVAFSALMYRAIGWRDMLVERWRRRASGTRSSRAILTA